MKRVVVLGVGGVVAIEAMAFALPDRRWAPVLSGAVAALTLVAVLRSVTHLAGVSVVFSDADDRAESLRRWVSRTETLIHRAESTRREWDRHLRPMLARQFEMATGQRQSRDRVAFRATGELVFGPQLWAWVDPDNIARSGGGEPGPGRAALDDILQRLQRI
jgi:hypothetical protein